MRCFVAVDIPEEIVSRIEVLQREMSNLGVTPVKPENLHFTLKFLGEVDMKAVGEVKKSLVDLAKQTRAFHIDIEGVGVFPNEKFIRVVWLGGPGLFNLQAAAEDAFGGMDRPVPHLTIARARSHVDAEEVRKFVAARKNIKIGSMRVDKIKLKKSTVLWNGPVYEDIGVFVLEG